jgi:RNA-directed DNA polymerase
VALAKQMGSETIEFIESRLEGKFQLEINREKTRVVDLREEGASLNFLGYSVLQKCTGKEVAWPN